MGTELSMRPRETALDFWRGVSIALVVGGHLVSFRLHQSFVYAIASIPQPPALRYVIGRLTAAFFAVSYRGGWLGVTIFFLISGYIITKALLEEESMQGAIDFRRFYQRRFFRIMPAYVVYIACAACFIAFGWIAVRPFPMSCIFFLANTTIAKCTPVFYHFWSLSVEEQFYGVLPFFLLAVPALFRVEYVAFFLVWVTAYAASNADFAGTWIINKESFGAVAAGCLYALSPSLRRRVRGLGILGDCLALFFFVGIPLGFFKSQYVIARFLYGLFAYVVLQYVIFRPLPAFLLRVRFLLPAISGLGLASYSLYLWQNIFSVPLEYPAGSPLAQWWLMFPAALVSYYAVERPVAAWARKRYAYIHHADAIRPAS